MDPLPIFEPGDMPSMVGANVELAADVEERPKKYIRGASARVPAWTFGQGWAKQTFPSTWHNQMISGTFSRMIEPEYGLFVWDDGDAPAEQKTLLEYVKWDDNAPDTLEGECPFLFKGVHALHNARQALFLLRGVLRKQVPRGVSGLDATLMREVKLEVKTADEFDLLFMSARASRDEFVAKNPKKQQTYSGDVAVRRRTISYSFTTLKQWAEYVGAEGAVFTKHGFDEKLCVGVIPTGVLKKGLGDDDAQTAWHEACAKQGLVPLDATRAIIGAESLLVSEVALSLAADARDTWIYLLDEGTTDDQLEYFYAFAEAGYATSPPAETRTLWGLKLQGHFGCIPKTHISWEKSKLVTAFFKETTIRDSGVPLAGVIGDGPPLLKFRPTIIARASGLITN